MTILPELLAVSSQVNQEAKEVLMRDIGCLTLEPVGLNNQGQPVLSAPKMDALRMAQYLCIRIIEPPHLKAIAGVLAHRTNL